MKKVRITAMLLVAMVLSCFMFTACSNGNKYDGKEFLLEDVSVTYDETVSQEAKIVQEALIDSIKIRISGEEKPFCRFYKKPHIILTNYDGLYRFAKYEVKNGKISRPIQTTKTLNNNLSYQIDYYRPLSIENYSEYENTASLENVDFEIKDGKLVLTESNDGITVKYVFAESGKVDETVNPAWNKTYSLGAVSYYHLDDEDVVSKEIYIAYSTYISSYTYDIKFPSSENCKIGENEYSIEIITNKNRIHAKTGFIKIGMNSFVADIAIYGDMLILTMSGSTSGSKGSFDLYYILS